MDMNTDNKVLDLDPKDISETYLICSDYYNQLLKSIKGYTIELGMSYTSRQGNTTVVDVKDKFVIDYYNKYNSLIYKAAIVGPITIYTDSKLNDTCNIYRNDEFTSKLVNYTEAKFSIEKNFVELLFI